MATETKVAHTPGPWKVGGVDENIWIERPNPADACICDLVQSVFDKASGAVFYTAEDSANARLIVVVTAMLDALREAADVLDDYSDVNDGDDGLPRPNKAMSALSIVEAAIAKAEGH